MTRPNQPLPVDDAPEPLHADLARHLAAALVHDLEPEPTYGRDPSEPTAAADDPVAAVRGRLLGRLAASQREAAAMITTRASRTAAEPLADGVTARTLYAADAARPARPGEPLRARLVDLAAGSAWPEAADEAGLHREWLVLDGCVRAGAQDLSMRDYLVLPAGRPAPALRALTAARLFLRESALPAAPGDRAHAVLDAEAGWPEFAPGVRRRVLWQRDGQAALLYHADAGASVPTHRHGHDEECLMVQGELFLDDVLLRAGDYQLAPAGTGHRLTETDTGVVIYAHGDLAFRFEG